MMAIRPTFRSSWLESFATLPRKATSPVVLGAALAVGALLAPAEASAADRPYGVAGQKVVKVETLDASTKLVSPTTGGPYPLIIASHGWSASGDNQVGWAKHFASYGFVVAVPSFPSPFTPDTEANSDIIVGLANSLRAAASATAHNVLATSKVGLEGHSAGGLATTVAASKLGPANVGAVVLFDPVDKDDAGKAAYAKLCTPLLGVFAEGSSCNNDAGWKVFATTTSAELIGFNVVGSTHCDGENAARDLCGLACGSAADPGRQKIYGSYATAFFLSRLVNDAAAGAVLTTASIAADTGVSSPLHTTTTCAVPSNPDAGSSSSSSSSGNPSSSSSSSSSTSGGPTGSSSGATTNPASPDGTESPSDSSGDGCGCRATGTESTGEGVLFGGFGLAFFVTLARRRRTR